MSVSNFFFVLSAPQLKNVAKEKNPKKSRANMKKKSCRSSRPGVLCKKGVVRNFTKFTGRHLCQSLFFDRVPGLRPLTLAQVFSYGFCKITKNTFFYGTPPVAASGVTRRKCCLSCLCFSRNLFKPSWKQNSDLICYQHITDTYSSFYY